MKRRLLFTLALAAPLAAAGAEAPYDEHADARAQVAALQKEAGAARLPVLLVFGANWCGDCKVLDMAFKQGAAAPLIAQHFKVLKINVGRFDRNVDLAEHYGVPLKKGIPAVAILSPEGKVVYTTKAGELADARNMGERAIYDFFARAAAGQNGR
ncbi:thiol reductase thioredoxin [Rubrivivax gelatinosus]|uniref:Thiol reductase thioredoxin n=1 Tax=Rubrivivax gelatinosus TaxID=28068 RepID=A0ABS1DZ20_RUBGE|nr:thiol reductase thioredoxin [Rubrivivax gelatinosus]